MYFDCYKLTRNFLQQTTEAREYGIPLVENDHYAYTPRLAVGESSWVVYATSSDITSHHVPWLLRIEQRHMAPAWLLPQAGSTWQTDANPGELVAKR